MASSSFFPPQSSLSRVHTLTPAALPLFFSSLTLCTDLAQGWSGCHKGGCHLRRQSANLVPPLGPRCPPPAPPPAALGTQQHRVTSWTSPATRQGSKPTLITVAILSQKSDSQKKYANFSVLCKWLLHSFKTQSQVQGINQISERSFQQK